jgi:hypothetical protein
VLFSSLVAGWAQPDVVDILGGHVDGIDRGPGRGGESKPGTRCTVRSPHRSRPGNFCAASRACSRLPATKMRAAPWSNITAIEVVARITSTSWWMLSVAISIAAVSLGVISEGVKKTFRSKPISLVSSAAPSRAVLHAGSFLKWSWGANRRTRSHVDIYRVPSLS